MDLIDILKYCPKCKGDFEKNSNRLLICANCGYKEYINPLPCNGVIIKNDLDQIMLVKRKVDPKKGYWDLPGGFIEPGESFADSVKREIREELGVEMNILKIVGIYNDYYVFENINYPTFGVVVEAEIVSGKLTSHDDISGYEFFPKDKVLEQELAFDSLKQSLKDYLNVK